MWGRRNRQPARMPRLAPIDDEDGLMVDTFIHWHNIVGESHCQPALERLAPRTDDGVELLTTAVLRSEPDNRADRNAVAVFIAGHKVGYLDRADTADWHRLLRRHRLKGTGIACEAVIRGGWSGRRASGPGHYGVKLNTPWPPSLVPLPGQPASQSGNRGVGFVLFLGVVAGGIYAARHFDLVPAPDAAQDPAPATAASTVRSAAPVPRPKPPRPAPPAPAQALDVAAVTPAVLAAAIRSVHHCAGVTRMMHAGRLYEAEELFYGTCTNGQSYAVTIGRQPPYPTKITSCAIMQVVGADCFRRLD